ncbi:hypothetical protein [Burkholderia cenocepacia]|uniref:hypothetical protein n=1 Tax=Burkholderia cenocepacia TaxID=95486 RepID=UPI002ABE0552|nr:hypothetical protein [Burkholderia cenocepacia]
MTDNERTAAQAQAGELTEKIFQEIRNADLAKGPARITSLSFIGFSLDEALAHARGRARTTDASIASAAEAALHLWAANGGGIGALERELTVRPVDALTLATLLSLALEAGAVAASSALDLGGDVAGRLNATANARRGAEAKHRGNVAKKEQLLAQWASGKYTNKETCADEECGALGVARATARSWLRGVPDPSPWPAKDRASAQKAGA